jgi:predicted dinucleotide-binding enzyme
MKIAIIGSGNVGDWLAQQWVKAGLTVLVGAKLHLSVKNIELAARISEERFGSVQNIAGQCDVI